MLRRVMGGMDRWRELGVCLGVLRVGNSLVLLKLADPGICLGGSTIARGRITHRIETITDRFIFVFHGSLHGQRTFRVLEACCVLP
jgi:hypothetical protein